MVAAVSFLVLPVSAQQQPFHGRTDLVSVYATVTDRSREPPTSFTIEQVDLKLTQPEARP
jgi:hypothetical protein